MPSSTLPATSSSIPEKILAVASRLFYQKGIRNVGIDEVVASSEVAKSTLYKYFPSKDVLVLRCLQRTDQRWYQWFQVRLEQQGSTPREKILAIFDVLEEYLSVYGFRGCPFVNATIELAEAEPKHPVRQMALDYKQKLRQYIVELVKDAEISEPETLSYQLLLLFEGAISLALIEGSPLAAKSARQAASMLLSPSETRN